MTALAESLLTPVGVVASSTQPNSPASPEHLIDHSGLDSDGKVSTHTADSFRDGGSMWNAAYESPEDATRRDTQAWLVFDLGAAKDVRGMRIWNGNEKTPGFDGTNRGVNEFEILAGDAEDALESVGIFQIAAARGEDADEGSEVDFGKPVKARYFKMQIISNHGGDIPSLSEVRFLGTGKDTGMPAPAPKLIAPRYTRATPTPMTTNPVGIIFPEDSGVINVRNPPYGAVGDGASDDTVAIQTALSEFPNQGKIIYLPHGVYKISVTLTWPKAPGGNSEKNTILQGQSREGTVLLLADNLPNFQNAKRPKPAVFTGLAPAQRFRNAVRNLTIDTGRGNPGAVGLQFNASNQGTVREVDIVSGDGLGVIGLDMAFTGEIGPCLIKNVRVRGFDLGVKCAHSVNSMTFENLEVWDQAVAGLVNDGQTVSIRGFQSRNSVPALINTSGFLTLLDADFQGSGEAKGQPAIINRADMMARNLTTSGYSSAIEETLPKATARNLPIGIIAEYLSGQTVTAPGSKPVALKLPVRETPDTVSSSKEDWISPLAFGGKPSDTVDDSAAIQAAIDSGKSVLYLPNGTWNLASPVVVRGNIRRIIGCEARLELTDRNTPGFVIDETSQPLVVIERLNGGYAPTTTVQFKGKGELVVQHSANINVHSSGGGNLFLEDVVSNPRQNWVITGGNVWARQWNPENEGTHIINNGANLWVLGLKTERGGTLVETLNGGRTEVLGGFSYTTTAGALAPMFVFKDSAGSITFREICFNSNPFREIVRDYSPRGQWSLLRDDPDWAGQRFLRLDVGNRINRG